MKVKFVIYFTFESSSNFFLVSYKSSFNFLIILSVPLVKLFEFIFVLLSSKLLTFFLPEIIFLVFSEN